MIKVHAYIAPEEEAEKADACDMPLKVEPVEMIILESCIDAYFKNPKNGETMIILRSGNWIQVRETFEQFDAMVRDSLNKCYGVLN